MFWWLDDDMLFGKNTFTSKYEYKMSWLPIRTINMIWWFLKKLLSSLNTFRNKLWKKIRKKKPYQFSFLPGRQSGTFILVAKSSGMFLPFWIYADLSDLWPRKGVCHGQKTPMNHETQASARNIRKLFPKRTWEARIHELRCACSTKFSFWFYIFVPMIFLLTISQLLLMISNDYYCRWLLLIALFFTLYLCHSS